MASVGQALLGGLVQGFGTFANMKYDEKQKAEKAERDQELVKLQLQLKQEAARFEAGLRNPQYQTIEDTGPDGKTVKRTIKSRYDPEKGPVEEIMGEAIIEPKDNRASVEKEYALYQSDPAGYAAMKRAGKMPTGTGDGSSDRVTFEEYSSWPQERKDAYDRYKGRAIKPDEDAKDRKWVTTQTAVAMRDFNKKPSYEQKPLLESAGIDPNDPDASKKYRNNIRDDLKTQMGIDLFEGSVRSGVNSTTKAPDKNPTAPKSPYPDGTKLEGPDGKTYIVKDGVPVPYGS